MVNCRSTVAVLAFVQNSGEKLTLRFPRFSARCRLLVRVTTCDNPFSSIRLLCRPAQQTATDFNGPHRSRC